MDSFAIRRRFLSLLAAILVLSAVAFAQVPAAPTAPDLAKLDAYFEKARADWDVPGLAIAIVKDGKVDFAKGYGVRELGKPDRVTPDTLFAIASNTKAFTAAALAILVEEGKLSWDDRVVKHLPYFQLYDPWVTAEIRVRDLLCHRSGLGTFSGDLLWLDTPYSREEVVRRARFLKPAGAFRSSYGYSNLMFITAGEVVTKVAGKPWEEFIAERFLEPLGMSNTVTTIRALNEKKDVATPHGLSEGVMRTFLWSNWDVMGAAGAIVSSVNDMAHWMNLQLYAGAWKDRKFFSETASRTMWTPHNNMSVSRQEKERSTNFRGYGLGWELSDYRGRLVAAHGGGYDGMYSRVALMPDEKLGVVVLTNSMTGISNALVLRVLDAYTGIAVRDWSAEGLQRAKEASEREKQQAADVEKKRVPNTKPSLGLEDYVGTFGGDLYGDATITVESGRLVLRLLPNPDFVADLTHWHFDTFVLRWRKKFPFFGDGKVQFLMDQNAKVVEMKLDVPNHDFWFHELEFKRKK